MIKVSKTLDEIIKSKYLQYYNGFPLQDTVPINRAILNTNITARQIIARVTLKMTIQEVKGFNNPMEFLYFIGNHLHVKIRR